MNRTLTQNVAWLARRNARAICSASYSVTATLKLARIVMDSVRDRVEVAARAPGMSTTRTTGDAYTMNMLFELTRMDTGTCFATSAWIHGTTVIVTINQLVH